MISTIFWLALFAGTFLTLAYHGVDLKRSTLIIGGVLLTYLIFGNAGLLLGTVLLVMFGAFVLLNFEEFRQEQISRRALAMYKKMLPNMSETEKAALDAGTV